MILVLIDKKHLTGGGSKLFFRLIDLMALDKEVVVLSDANLGLKVNLMINFCYNRCVIYLKNRYGWVCQFYSFLYYKKLLNSMVDALSDKYKNRNIEGIWTQSSDIMPILGLYLAAKFRCKLHISIFDLPFTYAYHDKEKTVIQSHIGHWLTQSDSFDFASDGMRDYVERWRGGAKKHIIVWSSAGLNDDLQPRLEIKRQINTIVFCGSLRFFKEIRALSEAIRLINETNGRNIVLRLFSSGKLKSPAIEFCGYIQSESQFMKEISVCDIAYSPLSFHPKDRILVETSFPSKIATYLAAGLPVIAHAPAFASTYQFVIRNQIGIGIDSLVPEIIAERILAYENDMEARRFHPHNTSIAIKKYFDVKSRVDFFNDLFH